MRVNLTINSPTKPIEKNCPPIINNNNPKKNKGITGACQALYNSLKKEGCEVLWDDRDQRAGVKFSDMELIGIPLMIIIGKKSYKENKVELKRRGQDKVELISPSEIALKIDT